MSLRQLRCKRDKQKATAHCYLCNCDFADRKVYEQMFEQRPNATGAENKTLAQILAAVLDRQLQEQQLHSTLMCSTCKVSLLNFEALQRQLCLARHEIKQQHTQTLQLYEAQPERESDDELSNDDSSLVDDLIEECAESPDLHEGCATPQELLESCSENAEDMDLIEECSDEDYEDFTVAQPPPKTTGKDRPAQSNSWACSYCGKTFARRQWLEEHERVHTGERPYKCAQCEASFAQRANWRTHMLVTHQNRANFQCGECGRAFKRKRLLDNHVRSKHSKVRDLKCEHCEATFNNAVNLLKHLLCHTGEKNYSCQICGKQFSRAENRNVHHFVHSIRKPYACVVCDEGFMRKQQLQVHIKATNHPNPRIVRRQPQFSAANSDKLQLQLQQRPLLTAASK